MSAAPVSSNANLFFNKTLVNTFVESVVLTLGQVAQITAVPGKPAIESRLSLKGEVAGIIGMVSGEMKGTLLICFTQASAFKIIESMLAEVHTTINSEVTAAVGELTNMIYGSAKSSLNKMGYNFEMALPTVVTGDFEIAGAANGVSLSIPFTIEPNIQLFIEIIVR